MPKPTRMPSVRSRNTTSRKVASSTTASPREVAHQRRELVLLGHVPGDDGEHGGERGERDVARERRRHQHEEQQEHRVQHAGDRPARAGADIGRGAGDGAGDADAAEQRRGDVGRALRHQLAVGAMPAPGHAVGDHRREQALDAAEQREGEGGGQHLDRPSRRRDAGRCGDGKRARNAAEARADRLDRQCSSQATREAAAPRRSDRPASAGASVAPRG